jgi:ribosomal protein S12 methylthiotransferase
LKRMRRPGNQEKMLERIRSWRTTCPDLAIRSTFRHRLRHRVRGRATDRLVLEAADALELGLLEPGQKLLDCPDLAIRSTFIVGFPGETEEEFEELLTWLKEAKLERITGRRLPTLAFWSLSETACCVSMKRRWRSAFTSAGPTVAKGRSKYDAPEIDGNVHVAFRRPVRVGDPWPSGASARPPAASP